jgi:hypothetical protein
VLDALARPGCELSAVLKAGRLCERREHVVHGVSIKELARRTGRSRTTIRAAPRASEPPAYRRVSAGSKLDPFKDETHRLLFDEPDMGQRVPRDDRRAGFGRGDPIVEAARRAPPSSPPVT